MSYFILNGPKAEAEGGTKDFGKLALKNLFLEQKKLFMIQTTLNLQVKKKEKFTRNILKRCVNILALIWPTLGACPVSHL